MQLLETQILCTIYPISPKSKSCKTKVPFHNQDIGSDLGFLFTPSSPVCAISYILTAAGSCVCHHSKMLLPGELLKITPTYLLPPPPHL